MGRGAKSKIDPERLRDMIRCGRITSEIAAEFGVHPPAVTRACHALGLNLPVRSYAGKPAPERGGGKPPKTGLAMVPKPGPVHPPRTASLIATGGRYADLSSWARTWGVSEVKARQEWFALRLPVAKGAAHG